MQVSTSLVRKFAGCLDILPSLWEAAAAPESTLCFLTTSPLCIALAMAEHRSQWVWCASYAQILAYLRHDVPFSRHHAVQR